MSDDGPQADESGYKLKDGWDKADIIGKWVTGILTGIVLTLLAYCVNTGANTIATTQKQSELAATLIKDLADSGHLRKDLALLALAHELPKSSNPGDSSADLVAQMCERLLTASQLGFDQGEVAFRLLSDRNPVLARRLTRERDSLAKAVADLNRRPRASGADTTGGTHQVTVAPLLANLTRAVVYLQYRPSSDGARDTTRMTGLLHAIQAAGFTAGGFEKIVERPGSSVRYFEDADRPVAIELSRIVLDHAPEVGPLRVYRPSYAEGKGILEVWLDLSNAPPSSSRAR